MFESTSLGREVDSIAPDGSEVRLLLTATGGSFAHFTLAAGETSVAVSHRTVDEIWFFVDGTGEMWRSVGGQESTIEVGRNTCITIPCGTRFQFRALGGDPLKAIAVTMPPWPGDGEAAAVEGKWTATVPPGPGLGPLRHD